MEDCLNAMREYDADLVMFQFDTISENNKPLLSNYRHNDFTEVQVLTPVEAIKKQVKAEIDGYFWAFLAPASTYQAPDSPSRWGAKSRISPVSAT